MESILSGVSTTGDNVPRSDSTLSTIDSELQNYEKPRLSRNLIDLMSESEFDVYVVGQRTRRSTLRERMETYMSSRTLREAQGPSSYHSLEDALDEAGKAIDKKSKQADHKNFLVWDVQPEDCEEKFGRVLFKFSTHFGACFLLKYKHAVDFVRVMEKLGKKRRCKAFYQIYNIDGSQSTLVKQDEIARALEHTINRMQPPPVDEDGNDVVDSANVIMKPSELSTVKRIGRFLERRRFRKVIRRQVGFAIGRFKRTRGRLFFAPFQLIYKKLFS
ncbi:MAG: hypothetical protein SGARI_005781, partial [Bacillariaceae sp.]